MAAAKAQTAAQEIRAITRYVLDPDENGQHLREMAEHMAREQFERVPTPDGEDPRRRREALVEQAAQTIAAFCHLAWGGAGNQEYARRSYLMLCALRDRMRGMDSEWTWHYAVEALVVDIQARLRRAEHLTLSRDGENEMVRHFFDDSGEFNYLHDLVANVMALHWQRRHGPDSPAAGEPRRRGVPIGPRGGRIMERHLRRAATEAVATYIEQANIAWGLVENPTDTGVVLRDRMNIQRELGAISGETWEASGWRLADFIETRFGTKAGRKEARYARARWRSLSGKRGRAT